LSVFRARVPIDPGGGRVQTGGVPTIRLARVYDPPGPGDGTRVLVDRLWPRGLSQDAAALDAWAKEVAPSGELRIWFGHDPARFEVFAERYRTELAAPERAAALDELRRRAARGTLTLLTATKSLDISHAAVLAKILRTG
jgi:uncharacterized protein YeaO (DUF488 family)